MGWLESRARATSWRGRKLELMKGKFFLPILMFAVLGAVFCGFAYLAYINHDDMTFPLFFVGLWAFSLVGCIVEAVVKKRR